MRILVTGAAGFIGSHLAHRLLDRGDEVVGLDNINDYYSVQLKRDRLARLTGRTGFSFIEGDLAKPGLVDRTIADHRIQRVVHLAAQAGVRYSITHPEVYIEANLVGFNQILEACRHRQIEHLVYASSSSVYGANTKIPFAETDSVDHPVSLYAATKKANELMAHCYSSLYKLPTTGLRFFTVYGPWGRPDMAAFLFTKAIVEGKPIDVFNHGKMQRDFTYVDDIVEGVIRVTDRIPTPNPDWTGAAPDPATSYAPYRVYNIGNNQPVELLRFIEVLEECLGRKATKNLLPFQQGDVPSTYANVDALTRDVGFRPHTSIEVGLRRFTDWYKDYYRCG